MQINLNISPGVGATPSQPYDPQVEIDANMFFLSMEDPSSFTVEDGNKIAEIRDVFGSDIAFAPSVDGDRPTYLTDANGNHGVYDGAESKLYGNAAAKAFFNGKDELFVIALVKANSISGIKEIFTVSSNDGTKSRMELHLNDQHVRVTASPDSSAANAIWRGTAVNDRVYFGTANYHLAGVALDFPNQKIFLTRDGHKGEESTSFQTGDPVEELDANAVVLGESYYGLFTFNGHIDMVFGMDKYPTDAELQSICEWLERMAGRGEQYVRHKIVNYGDSILESGVITNLHDRFHYKLWEALGSLPSVYCENIAIAGSTTSLFTSTFSVANLLAYFEDHHTIRGLICHSGTNDLYINRADPDTEGDLYDRVEAHLALLQEQNWAVVLDNVIANSSGTALNSSIVVYNALLPALTDYDALADVAGIPELDPSVVGVATSSDYYVEQPSGIHPNADGMALMVPVIKAAYDAALEVAY